MKNTIICFLFLFFLNTVFCQETPPSDLKSSLLSKSKDQKVLAITSLSIGSVLATIGFAKMMDNSLQVDDWGGTGNEDHEKAYNAGMALFITGAVFQGVSIPLFIFSKKNKSKAMSMSFTNEKFKPALAGKNAFSYYPAIALNIRF